MALRAPAASEIVAKFKRKGSRQMFRAQNTGREGSEAA
jgi:hypothetical protein